MVQRYDLLSPYPYRHPCLILRSEHIFQVLREGRSCSIPHPILCYLFLNVCLIGQTVNFQAPLDIDPNVKIGKFDNGLTYYIRNNHKPEKRVYMYLAVNAGSVYENEDQQGLAHLTEHMAFNGTKHFKKNELVDALEKMGVKFGAELNAHTSFNETVYNLQIPSDKTDLIDK